MREVRTIRTPGDHRAALSELASLWGAPPGSRESDRLDLLATLIEVYEDQSFALPACPGGKVLKAFMAQKGHTQAELAALLGSASRASEVLSGKRDLSRKAYQTLLEAWAIPPGCAMRWAAEWRPAPVVPARSPATPRSGSAPRPEAGGAPEAPTEEES